MNLQTIEATFAAAAKAEWAKIAAEGKVIEQVIVADSETAFAQLSVQFAPLVMSIISDLAQGEIAKLSGDEKTNLAATTLVDKTAQQGITMLAADATGLIKNGFEAFKQFAPALGIPVAVGDEVSKAIDTAEKVVEGAVDQTAGAVAAKIPTSGEPGAEQ